MITHHAQVILVHEMTITVHAVCLVVIQCGHVLVSSCLGMEDLVACVTGDSGSPVVYSVHMLIGGSNGAEFSIAGLTFGPVIVIVKMFHEVTAIPEFLVAIIAFKHCENCE